jgi:hypothetical protein
MSFCCGYQYQSYGDLGTGTDQDPCASAVINRVSLTHAAYVRASDNNIEMLTMREALFLLSIPQNTHCDI